MINKYIQIKRERGRERERKKEREREREREREWMQKLSDEYTSLTYVCTYKYVFKDTEIINCKINNSQIESNNNQPIVIM